MTQEDLYAKFDARLAALPTLDERLDAAAEALARAFHVKHDEVAIFSFDPKFDSLRFLWPKKLRTAGSVPLSAHRSLVAKTAQERNDTLDNAFAATPHVFIFERFRLDITGGVPIQKIMSVPMLAGGELKGVIQVSRKGEERDGCGPDFSPGNLAALSRLAALIAARL
jgi:GAF domain-containing protein